MLHQSDVLSSVLELVRLLLPALEASSRRTAPIGAHRRAAEALATLHTAEKTFINTDTLMVRIGLLMPATATGCGRHATGRCRRAAAGLGVLATDAPFCCPSAPCIMFVCVYRVLTGVLRVSGTDPGLPGGGVRQRADDLCWGAGPDHPSAGVGAHDPARLHVLPEQSARQAAAPR